MFSNPFRAREMLATVHIRPRIFLGRELHTKRRDRSLRSHNWQPDAVGGSRIVFKSTLIEFVKRGFDWELYLRPSADGRSRPLSQLKTELQYRNHERKN